MSDAFAEKAADVKNLRARRGGLGKLSVGKRGGKTFARMRLIRPVGVADIELKRLIVAK